jgi:hypothetical protein
MCASWVRYLERVASTFLQAFIAALLATSSGGQQSKVDWVNSLLVGVFAALACVLTSVLTLMPKVKKFFDDEHLDLVYRTVMTFAQTFVGLVAAAGLISALSFDYDTAFKTSVIAAGTALLKALIGVNSATSGAATLGAPQAG